jgi:hypothetical protein
MIFNQNNNAVSTQRTKIFTITVFVVLSLLSIFYLPWHVKMAKPIISVSYDYGFNNKVSVVSILLSIIALTLIRMKYGSTDESIDGLAVGPSEVTKDDLPHKHFYIGVGIHLFIILSLLILTGNDPGYGESTYFIDRADKVLHGLKPYVDFEYAYGPLFIYLPALLFKILNPIGLTLKGCYCAVFTVIDILGIYIVYQTFNLLKISAKQKSVMYYLIVLPSFPFQLGLNYVLLRYIAPCVSLIFLNYKYCVESTSMRSLKYVTLSLVLIALNLSISPEAGIAFYISLIFFTFLLSCQIKSYIWSILALILIPLSVLTFMSPAYFEAVTSFGKGGNNFPVVMSPSIVLYVFSVIYFASDVIKKYALCKKNHISIALILLVAIYIPAAMGRCDPGHIFFDGLLIFTIAFISLAKNEPIYFKVYALLFALVFLIGMPFSDINMYYPVISKYFHQTDVSPNEANKDIINQLSIYSKVGTPLSVYDDSIMSYLKNTGKYVPVYYMNEVNVFASYQIDKRISQMLSNDYKIILVHKNIVSQYNHIVKGDYPTDVTPKQFSLLFLYPFNFEKINSSVNIRAKLYEYIFNNYTVVYESDHHLLLRRV